jgi:hypothetical protein
MMETAKFLRNVDIHLSDYTASHPRTAILTFTALRASDLSHEDPQEAENVLIT